MTKEQLNKRIKSIISDTAKLEEIVHIMDAADPEHFPEKYEACYLEAVRRAEWLTCRLRHLLYQSTLVRKNVYLLQAAETLGIKFCNRDGISQFTLPGIVLGSNRNRPSEFLFDPLNAALFEWLRNRLLTRYHRCVVCFVLFFDREICERVVPDTSNPELKLYMDAAATCLLIDDSPKYMDLHHSVELGDRHAVEMFIMEPDRFPQWLRLTSAAKNLLLTQQADPYSLKKPDTIMFVSGMGQLKVLMYGGKKRSRNQTVLDDFDHFYYLTNDVYGAAMRQVCTSQTDIQCIDFEAVSRLLWEGD